MSENFKSKFSVSGLIQTKDGYRINLIGTVESSSPVENSKLNSLISSASSSYFLSQDLIECISIVEKNEYDDLRIKLFHEAEKSGIVLLSFKILTLDAKYNEDDVSLQIDPNLESGSKKKKGLLGRFFRNK